MPRKKADNAAASKAAADLLKGLPEFGEIAVDQLPDDVQQVFDQLGDDVTKVMLYRRGREGKQSYVGTVDADEFDLDFIAQTYGGGRYLARLVGNEGILKGLTFYIDDAVKPKPHREDGANAEVARLIERLIDKMDTPRQDPMQIAASLGAVAATQMQTMMQMILPLLSNKGGGGAPANDILEAVQLGISLGGKDEGYMPVIREIGIPLVKSLQSIAGKGQHTALSTRSEVPQQPQQPQQPPTTQPPWVAMVAPYVAKLIEFAQRGDDPGLWAAVLDAQYPRFAKWLESAVLDESFKEQLYQFFPALKPFDAWVVKLLDEFMPEPPTAEEVEPETEGGQ